MSAVRRLAATTPVTFASTIEPSAPNWVISTGALVRGHRPTGCQLPAADSLRREQLAKEGPSIDAGWGVVGCLYTATPEELPMVPITMLRNALGVAEGGSGVPLDRARYRRAVAFWEQHVNWRE